MMMVSLMPNNELSSESGEVRKDGESALSLSLFFSFF